MKHIFYVFLVSLCFNSYVYAQEKTDSLLDSINQKVEIVFKAFQKNKYAETIVEGQKILDFAKKHNELELVSKMYSLLGSSYFYSKNYKLCFDYLHKANAIHIKLKDTASAIVSYNDIAVNYSRIDSIKKYDYYIKKSLDLGRKSSDKFFLIYPLRNVGANLLDKGKFKEALEYLKEADIIVEEVSNKRSIRAAICRDLYYVYHNLKDFEKSKYYFNKGINFAEDNEYFNELSLFYSDKAYLHAADGNYKIAYEALEKHKVIADTVNTIREFETIKQIEADNFLRENRNKLRLVEKEKEFQDTIIKKAKSYNILLAIFSLLMLFSLYYIYKKNKQLNLAKEKAEKLSRVKSDFYSEISHELRTPLYAVIELSNLLLKENVSSKHKEYLESLNFSGNHLLSLINNVLELNKVESGKMTLDILDFKPKDLISNIIESLEFALRDSNNKIHLNYDEKIPNELSGDSLKLSQVFINLIGNAIKFTSHGNIYVTIKLVGITEGITRIFFEVKDDGLGISKEKQIKIFEEFYQEHTKNDNSYKGTGLGLSIVKRIIHIMGSEISVESELDKGTAFSFELLLPVSDNTSNKEVEYTSLIDDLVDKYILIVDDNKINQLVTKKILDQFNIKSKTVDSGEKAIKTLKNEVFDCVLMDIHMPKLNGYETTSLIRKFNENIPIVALTAASSEEVESKINNYSMNGYVMKPFITSDFIKVIHKAIHS